MNRHMYPQSRHDWMGPASVGLRLEPAVGPHMTEQLLQPRFYFFRSPRSIHPRRPLLNIPHHRACRQFAFHVQEQFFGGDGFRVAPLDCGNGCPDHLDHIVQQQAEGELEHGRLRRSADQCFQMKHLGDLLEHPLDAPAFRVQREQVGRRVFFRVQKIGQQHDVFLAGAQQRDAAHRAAPLVRRAADPAPVLDELTAPMHLGPFGAYATNPRENAAFCCIVRENDRPLA